ncbi:unnamed protein product [Spodoptera littoralis]|uniref:Endonuclease-reverse transcriptase n=1 Tax=Spodoptera littoralis TaxID=7109 RepID=A0A9P0I2A6_SPOLI|nr:unnamed protein product [Spodoptera littoralis]CAH1638413.1 unnamed protein product [Spodoptera littoralis]
MEDQFELLFEKMKLEMQKQTAELKDSITNSIMEKIEEKIKPIIAENKDLKEKIITFKKEIEYLKRDRKENNIIIFGLQEKEGSTPELINVVKNIFFKDLNINIGEFEINKIFRIGRKSPGGKPRPVLLSFVNSWKKNEIMKVRKNLKDIYITEDYSKEVLERRKILQNKLKEERMKGNFAYLSYDKLVVKENNTNIEKRKRGKSSSPQDNTQTKKQQVWTPSHTNRRNAFDVMRGRSNSLSLSSPKADNRQ